MSKVFFITTRWKKYGLNHIYNNLRKLLKKINLLDLQVSLIIKPSPQSSVFSGFCESFDNELCLVIFQAVKRNYATINQ